jgi:hypothetical protein
VLPDILDIISKKGQEDNNPKKKTKLQNGTLSHRFPPQENFKKNT